MPAGYPEYPGPSEAVEGETYTYELPDGETVAATVKSVESTESGPAMVSLSIGGGA